MTVDIANRLVEMRKKHGYSQEKLAELLGLSRQAVSKWERAEASPDTDNLILLSRLYGVSLDELLNTEEDNEAFVKEEETKTNSGKAEQTKAYGDDISIGSHGIHVNAKNGDVVHIGWDGIHVNERGEDRVHIDKDGIFVDDGYNQYINKYDRVVINGVEYSKRKLRRDTFWLRWPYALLAVIAMVVISAMMGSMHPAWIILLTIPVVESFIRAIIYRDAHTFAYPIVAFIAYLCLGFFMNLWHPGWVVFLTVPVFYAMIPKGQYRAHDDSDDETDRDDDAKQAGDNEQGA